MYEGKKCTMILLSGGSGKRMGYNVAKQYLEIGGRPLLTYSLDAIETSRTIDECILVIRPEDEEFVQKGILDMFSFTKVRYFAFAGEERYASVWSGLVALAGYDWSGLDEAGKKDLLSDCEVSKSLGSDIVLIHDGARPFLTEELINRCAEGAIQKGACIAAVPSKDTVKIVDEDGCVIGTPDRKNVWNIQTPQAFDAQLIYESYRQAIKNEDSTLTDDSQVVERYGDHKSFVCMGDYKNIKITTPEDMTTAESFLK